jgi:hypothetical protein
MKVARLKEAFPTAKVELWCEDEHRLGLKPIDHSQSVEPYRRKALCEGPPALRVEVPLLLCASQESGEAHWLILPTVNARVFSLALEHFAKEVEAGTRKRILLVLDQAGWHTAKEVEVPEGIDLEFLPPASPELQPSERLWPLSNEGVANRHFEEIEELEEAYVLAHKL